MGPATLARGHKASDRTHSTLQPAGSEPGAVCPRPSLHLPALTTEARKSQNPREPSLSLMPSFTASANTRGRSPSLPRGFQSWPGRHGADRSQASSAKALGGFRVKQPGCRLLKANQQGSSSSPRRATPAIVGHWDPETPHLSQLMPTGPWQPDR